MHTQTPRSENCLPLHQLTLDDAHFEDCEMSDDDRWETPSDSQTAVAATVLSSLQ